MPKIELHCHLDGSIGPKVIQKLLAQMGEECDIRELEPLLFAPEDCGSLTEYLEKFKLPLRCIQTREGLVAAAEDLALTAAKENVTYLEVRFAPSLCTARGLSVLQAIEAVREGLKLAEQKTGIRSGILVCAMRELSPDVNLGMLKEAMELYRYGVVGCDLAGDENAYPTSQFTDFFELANKYEIPCTIHSGECGSTENIRQAIQLGARRIGHGIAMSGDRELTSLCAAKRIGVELCPTSNLQTKAVRDFNRYPFLEFYHAGIPVSVNTDNRTVSGTTCTDEFMRLSEAGMMNERISERVYCDSVDMCFADDDVKHELLQALR